MIYSKRLLELRLEYNWTQAKLAEESGVGQSLIARYENGANPSKANLGKLAKAFNISVTKLMEQEDSLEKEMNFAQAIKESRKLPAHQKKVLTYLISLMIREKDFTESFSNILSRRKP